MNKTMLYFSLITYIVSTNLYGMKSKSVQGSLPQGISIHEAVRQGIVDIVKKHLDNGISPDAQNPYGSPPLHIAAQNGHKDCVEALLKKGAQIEAQNSYGSTPLHGVAYKGHKDCVEALLKKGAHIEAQNSDGWTPLHLAAYNGHKECFKILISYGWMLLITSDYAVAQSRTLLEQALLKLKRTKIKVGGETQSIPVDILYPLFQNSELLPDLMNVFLKEIENGRHIGVHSLLRVAIPIVVERVLEHLKKDLDLLYISDKIRDDIKKLLNPENREVNFNDCIKRCVLQKIHALNDIH